MGEKELCCEHAKEPDCVKWNPFNKVVQCHSCGHTYEAVSKRAWGDNLNGQEVKGIHTGGSSGLMYFNEPKEGFYKAIKAGDFNT